MFKPGDRVRVLTRLAGNTVFTGCAAAGLEGVVMFDDRGVNAAVGCVFPNFLGHTLDYRIDTGNGQYVTRKALILVAYSPFEQSVRDWIDRELSQ